jgi:hypothetical protein
VLTPPLAVATAAPDTARPLSGSRHDRVAYPVAADNVSGLLASRLRSVNQLVISTRNAFSTLRRTQLACI